MKKSYSFLEKKLQETEEAHAQNEDIKQRIEFLKYLIQAEVSPHPSDSIPSPLLSISKQLTRLESGYLKGKHYGTTSPGSSSRDPMPELETVEASPVFSEKTASNREANEKSTVLKIYCCWCLVMMMSNALFCVIGAILMLSFCGCSGYYYHNNNIRLQYAPGFTTPT